MARRGKSKQSRRQGRSTGGSGNGNTNNGSSNTHNPNQLPHPSLEDLARYAAHLQAIEFPEDTARILAEAESTPGNMTETQQNMAPFEGVSGSSGMHTTPQQFMPRPQLVPPPPSQNRDTTGFDIASTSEVMGSRLGRPLPPTESTSSETGHIPPPPQSSSNAQQLSSDIPGNPVSSLPSQETYLPSRTPMYNPAVYDSFEMWISDVLALAAEAMAPFRYLNPQFQPQQPGMQSTVPQGVPQLIPQPTPRSVHNANTARYPMAPNRHPQFYPQQPGMQSTVPWQRVPQLILQPMPPSVRNANTARYLMAPNSHPQFYPQPPGVPSTVPQGVSQPIPQSTPAPLPSVQNANTAGFDIVHTPEVSVMGNYSEHEHENDDDENDDDENDDGDEDGDGDGA